VAWGSNGGVLSCQVRLLAHSQDEGAAEAASDRAALSCWRQCGLSMLCLMAGLQLLADMDQGIVTWDTAV
jgi:hypothetical protein